MSDHAKWIIGVVVALSLAATAWLVVARPYDSQSNRTQNETANSSQSSNDNSQANGSDDQQGQQSKDIPVSVYFSKLPESTDDPSQVFPVERTVSDLGVGEYSLQQLIEGPTADEYEQGYRSNVNLSGESICGSQDFTVEITDQTATVQFCREVELSGVLTDARAQNQIEATLMQFDTVDEVVILNRNGDCLFDASGQNRCLQ